MSNPHAIRRPSVRVPVRTIGAQTIDFDRRTAVMAIVNRTPDSFYDAGRTFALDKAVAAALAAVEAGADWVDIGGAPFSPGPPIAVADELDRVRPVIEAVRAQSDVVISVDTFHPEVAARCIEAGANVINDTTGLRDPAMREVVADSSATAIITHSLAEPRTVYPRPHYDDVVTEVRDFLARRVELAVADGIPEDRLVVDPGHDLNKNTLHSLELTRRFGEFASLGLPTLVAASNKDFIGEVLDAPRESRVSGSLAVAALCVASGARIVRVHEVAETVAAVRMTEAVLGLREPARLVHNMGDRND